MKDSDPTSNAVRILRLAASAFSALDTIGDLATGVLGRQAAIQETQAALHVIGALAAAVRAGLEGTATAVDVENALVKLQADLESNDQAADASLDAKFPR
jgi:hypothetical protein